MFAACLLLGWLSSKSARDREAISAIRSEGGHVVYDYAPESSWRSSAVLGGLLRGSFLGEGVVWGVHQVSYYPSIHLTDAGLRHLREFPETVVLGLGETRITDDGLAHLSLVRQLRVLYLAQTAISDSGLKHLQALSSLEALDLANTGISDVGLEKLGSLRSLRTLYLGSTSITDDGLVHLHSLSDLQLLDLTGTRVTSAGVANLRTALPDCQIDFP
jgi:hypothetical protein